MIIGLLLNKNPIAQSICTHYSCFENMDRFVTLKKKDPKYGLQKAGCQKTGSLLFKKRRGQAASTLYNRSHLVLFLPRQKMEAILFLFLPKHFCCLFKKIPIIDCSNQLLIASMYIRHLAANSHQIQTLDALEPNWYLNLRFDVLNYYDRVDLLTRFPLTHCTNLSLSGV